MLALLNICNLFSLPILPLFSLALHGYLTALAHRATQKHSKFIVLF
jgi:hypothetical protein